MTPHPETHFDAAPRLRSRRSMLPLIGGAVASLGVGPRVLHARARELVVVNWGGAAVRNYDTAYGKPFAAETGIDVEIDGSGPLPGRIKAMVESRQVVWDVCDADLFTAMKLGAAGLLEPIDYALVDRNKVEPGYAVEHGIASYIYSWGLAYDSERFGQAPPMTATDIFDTQKFPGKRALYNGVQSTCELALLADGVAPESLYPLDIPRAVRKVKSLGRDLVLWGRDAEAQRLLQQGEVAMAVLGHPRASLAVRDSGGRVQFLFAGAMRSAGAWMVPRGNPAGAALANQFIASTQDPQRQLQLFLLHGSGPVNPAVEPLIPPEAQAFNPNTAAHRDVQFGRNDVWYAERYEEASIAFRDLIAAR